MSTARARQLEPIDALCFRVLGRTAGVVETTLELNPGLDRHALLPEGFPVRLPDAPKIQARKLVNLWD
ncbi:MAG: tail protein X [Proteobacteria bacterium]|nr:tail protein X [Pseudomonadota bacterium]